RPSPTMVRTEGTGWTRRWFCLLLGLNQGKDLNILPAPEGVFCDELGFAFPKIGEGYERQGGPERFCPMRKARGENLQAAIQEVLEMCHNTSHPRSFSIP